MMLNDNSSRDYLPNLAIVGSTVYRKQPKPNVSIKDVMKVSEKYRSPPFGHSFYKSPSNEMLMKKIQLGFSERTK